MQKSFHFLWFAKKIIDLFVDPTHNLNYKGKQNSEKIQRVKMTKLNLKANDICLTIISNLLYFHFTKSRQKTLETMNISNLRRKNLNISLANYVIKQLKSINLYPSVLVVGRY